MKIIGSPKTMTRRCARWRKDGLRVGFVPTMGALHAAHLSLVRRARKENDRVVVSVFINPSQFGPHEDLARYPRPFKRDAAACRAASVDALYHPRVAAVYPRGFRTFVEVEGLSSLHCGRFRPGHFRGVATVVLKFLEVMRPERLYLGQKDYQQLVVLRAMVRDLDLPVRVVGCPTLREPDGLAMSSRNVFLSSAERQQALHLYRALRLGAAYARRKKTTAAGVRALMRREVLKIPRVNIDYLEIADAKSLNRPRRLKGRLRLLGAIRIGGIRLIDNIPLMV